MYQLVLILAIVMAVHATPTQDPFYIIAHMANNRPALEWAVAQGANAIENDLQFDADGNPTIFEHRTACDCKCKVNSDHICGSLMNDCGGFSASRNAVEHMQHVARLDGIALYLIDSKITPEMGAALVKAGTSIIPLVDTNLFGYGYKGKVVIGCGKFEGFDYIRAAATAARSSPYKDRYFFTFDEEKNDYLGVMDLLSRFTNNRVFGTGISSCLPDTYYTGIRNGVEGRKNGQNGLTYIWTLDKESSMQSYINEGVHGIMTNRVAVARKVATSMGLRIAVPSDDIPVSTTSVPPQDKCDCNYHPGGCTISRPPPIGKACKCNYLTLLWTCQGSVVSCNNPASAYCTNPDLSPSTCILGGGDCDGYPNSQSCDCSYIKKGFFRRSGCKITRPMIQGLACRCSYHALWRCSGSPAPCDISNPKCAQPDASKEACQLGRGDCDGY